MKACAVPFSTVLSFVQPLFNFTASKYVFIKDWRLGVILRVLQVVTLAYVLTDIFQQASYLITEVPTGYVTVWPDGQSMEAKSREFEKQSSAVREGNLDYCQNPDRYEFEWSGITHENFECAFLDPASLFMNGESEIFLTTSMRVEKLHFYTTEATGSCASAADLGEGFRSVSALDGACGYTEAKAYFPILPEDISLNLIHSYRTSSVVDKKGTLPTTILRAPNFDSGEIQFNAGEEIQVTLDALLNLAGIDLDRRLDEQDNAAAHDASQGRELANNVTQYPFARLSGLTLHVTLNYYTRRVAPGRHNKPTGDNADDIICLVDVIPENKWSFLGSDIREMMNTPRDPLFLTPGLIANLSSSTPAAAEILSSQTDFQRNGVTLIFSVSGSIGRFDISALIAALVAGSVLLAVAQQITTYVALYALGISSELYRAFMRETVDWRQEYARYAAQACVAGYAFMRYDANRSMELDRREVFDLLRKLMGKNKDLEDWHLAALADFLMRQGETEADVQKGRFNPEEETKESFISMTEWIDIFTEDKANWPALKRLIVHEYPDDKSREGVMDLLDRSTRARNMVAREKASGSAHGKDGYENEQDGTPRTPASDLEANLKTPLI